MRSLRNTTAALVATCLGLAVTPAADANTFTMVSCTAGQLESYPWDSSGTPWMRATPGCARGDGLVLWADIANGPNLPYASHAKWVLSVPAPLKIRRIRGEIRLNQGAGWAAGLFDESNGNWLYGGPPCLGQCGNGVFTVFDLQALDSNAVSFVMLCYAAVCNPVMTSAIRNLEATIEDSARPRVRLTGGTLVNGSWVHGDANISFHADDETGIARTEVFVDGQQRVSHEQWCQPLRLPACDPSLDDSASLSTRLFAGDGPRTLTVRATDYSGNTGDASVTVRADNTAPIAPLGLSNASGEWVSTNRFALRWTNPSQVDGAPIAGAVWRVCPVGRAGECVAGHRDGTNLSEITDLSVPARGQWRVAVALQDAAANTDARNASELVLGFDDTPPDVAIVPTNPEDPTRLQVAADDDGAPIVRGDVELRRHGSRVWRGVSTRVTDIGLEAVIDDEVLASGDYDVRAHAWNAAGLERSTDNWTSGQAALLTLPLRIATRVRLGAAKHRGGNPRARTVLVRRPIVAYGRRVRLTGQLVAPGGNPLVDVPVQVSSRIDGPQAAWRPVAELRTDRTGHVRYVIARGPSRVLRFRYAGTPTIRSIARDVPVRVRASTSMAVSRHNVVNGDAVRFRGRIRGGHLPARKRVELQFFARGQWRTFASTRANRRGRWGYTYRFDGSRGTVRWKFRALITPETGYPYTTGRSRRQIVTVRGLP
jgi:hypothetical protein